MEMQELSEADPAEGPSSPEVDQLAFNMFSAVRGLKHKSSGPTSSPFWNAKCAFKAPSRLAKSPFSTQHRRHAWFIRIPAIPHLKRKSWAPSRAKSREKTGRKLTLPGSPLCMRQEPGLCHKPTHPDHEYEHLLFEQNIERSTPPKSPADM